MKFILLCLPLGAAFFTQAQSPGIPNNAIAVLQKTSAKLQGLTTFSYRQTRETRYYEGNYHNTMAADLYIEYMSNSPTGLRFQARRDQTLFVYDGQRTLHLDNEAMTIDSTTARTAQQLEGNSYLSHSLAMLRINLPIIISDGRIQKTLNDTVIGNQHYHCVKIEWPGRYFLGFNGTDSIGVANLQRPYYLVIDKKTYLPHTFISKYIRGSDDRDFLTTTYTAISTKPARPATASWQYSTYATRYSSFRREQKKPLVKVGARIDDFTLPNYTPAAIDSISLHQYAGKIVLLDFWFKSCGPCMVAMPHYNALQNKFGHTAFQLLTVNIEDGESDMQFFYNKYQPAYKMLYKGRKLFKSMGLPGCPSLVLLDKKGEVLCVFTNGFEQELIEKKIEEALAL
jgi:thiol-disulfide isomerase/thioredoxin/outer membrane lipoprotein-sorting protein